MRQFAEGLNALHKLGQPPKAPKPPCAFDGCPEESVAGCECCEAETRFCEDHGSVGHDRSVQDVGEVAYPNACWKCGGFNADA